MSAGRIPNAGTVHVAADLAGYYIDHTHDDRYYTKHQLDSTRAVSRTVYGAAGSVLNGKPMSTVAGCATIGPDMGEQGGTMLLAIDVPAGSMITRINTRMLDGTALIGYSIAFQRVSPSITGMSSANLRASTGGAGTGPVNVDLTPALPVTVAPGDRSGRDIKGGDPHLGPAG